MKTPEEDCVMYLERWKACKSLRSQFHSYCVYGERKDCSILKDDLDMCLKWKKEDSLDAKRALLQREDQLTKESQRVCFWELRTAPPADWPKPGSHILNDKKSSESMRITSTSG